MKAVGNARVSSLFQDMLRPFLAALHFLRLGKQKHILS